MDSPQHWPALEKDDAGLKQEIEQLLTSRAVGDPYSDDGSFAASIARLPPGLRAMAATHWLDISLTLDSITWHFGNFGVPGLKAALNLIGFPALLDPQGEFLAENVCVRLSLSASVLSSS